MDGETAAVNGYAAAAANARPTPGKFQPPGGVEQLHGKLTFMPVRGAHLGAVAANSVAARPRRFEKPADLMRQQRHGFLVGVLAAARDGGRRAGILVNAQARPPDASSRAGRRVAATDRPGSRPPRPRPRLLVVRAVGEQDFHQRATVRGGRGGGAFAQVGQRPRAPRRPAVGAALPGMFLELAEVFHALNRSNSPRPAGPPPRAVRAGGYAAATKSRKPTRSGNSGNACSPRSAHVNASVGLPPGGVA